MRRDSLVQVLVVALLIGTLLAGAGCGSSRNPGDTVVQFYTLVGQGRFDAASRYLSSDARMMFSFMTALAAGLQQYFAEQMGGQGVKRVEIRTERITGDRAEVTYVVHYTDGTNGGLDSEILVKEGGEWKIGLGF